MLTKAEKEYCLDLARSSIAFKLKLINEIPACPSGAIFTEKYGLFVTLHKNGRLRGCIGYILPYKDLYTSIIELGQAAAFRDNRFSPVKIEEIEHLQIEISILSPLYEISDIDEIEIGRDGLYIQHPYSSGLLLPQVAIEHNWDKNTFLIETCRKAGLPSNILKDKSTKIYRFEAEIFS